MKRSGIKPKRATPRRREAPRWDWDEWQVAGPVLAARAGHKCEWCGTAHGPWERHHRKRRRDGGDRFANILMLCAGCHHWTTEHPKEARRVGLIVSVSRDPAEVPFLSNRDTWVMLTDDGFARVLFDPPKGEDAHA